jgi:hypothetical protein
MEPILWILLAATFVFAVLLYLFTCLIFVKKDHIAIIERGGRYVCTTTKRVSFYPWYAYRRAGMYSTQPCMVAIEIQKGSIYNITYQIKEVLLFHYSSTTIEAICRRALLEHQKITPLMIKDALQDIGLTLLALEK